MARLACLLDFLFSRFVQVTGTEIPPFVYDDSKGDILAFKEDTWINPGRCVADILKRGSNVLFVNKSLPLLRADEVQSENVLVI